MLAKGLDDSGLRSAYLLYVTKDLFASIIANNLAAFSNVTAEGLLSAAKIVDFINFVILSENLLTFEMRPT